MKKLIRSQLSVLAGQVGTYRGQPYGFDERRSKYYFQVKNRTGYAESEEELKSYIDKYLEFGEIPQNSRDQVNSGVAIAAALKEKKYERVDFGWQFGCR